MATKADLEKSARAFIGGHIEFEEECETFALDGGQREAVALALMYWRGVGVKASKDVAFAWIKWAKNRCDLDPDPECVEQLLSLDDEIVSTISVAAKKRGQKILEGILASNFRVPKKTDDIPKIIPSQPPTTPTDVQVANLRIVPTTGPDAKERILGSMLGGAVGDALGAPIEFMSWEQIKKQFGDRGLRDYVVSRSGRKGWITDDTQMTLFTAEGLIRAEVRGWNKGITNHTSCVSHAYLRWLKTQGLKPNTKIGTDGWLFAVNGLHEACAPGKTCLSALQAMRNFTNEVASNTSKGCGGVMRVAPVGLIAYRGVTFPGGQNEIFNFGKEFSWLTHGHPSGYLSGGAFALIIAQLMNGDSLQDAIHETLNTLLTHDGHEETTKAILQAVGLATVRPCDPNAIELLGEGWVAEEALAIAIYCALSYDDFKEAVLMAVNHSGDSDSTGSMTGNLLGAALGIDAIPSEWLRYLELEEPIRKMAEDMNNFHEWDLEDESVWERYPGW